MAVKIIMRSKDLHNNLQITATRAVRLGGCVKVGDKDAKEDKDLQAGKQHILDTLAEKTNHEIGYKTEVNLPDLQICQQVSNHRYFNILILALL